MSTSTTGSTSTRGTKQRQEVQVRSFSARTRRASFLSARDDGGVRWRPGDRLERLFEAVCDQVRSEHRVAVDAGGVVLTYDQLDAQANRLARRLLELGACPGDRIALLFDHAVAAYTAMLAVLKIHAAYVPLDPGFPEDRIAYIVDDAEVSFVLTLAPLRERVPDVEARLVCLDEEQPRIDVHEASRPTVHSSVPQDALAYIIYTSGSTGRPKGVAVEHASICNFVRVAAQTYGITARDRVYQGMTIAFDFSVEEIWVPWAVGATLVPKPRGAALLGAELAEFLAQNHVTAMCCVPTLLATIEEDLPGLRFLLVSGEACPRDLIVRWHRPDRRFLNVYGPTEATVTATMAVARPDRPVTLGTPLPTYTAVILAPDEPRALPPGELGEIGLAGIGLAQGYVHREDLTAKAFIPDFLDLPDNPSGRIYRTGDLGRFTEDGEIEYHGRIDTQVKVRGYRIELSEIESVLLRVPGIAQAVVNTYEPEPGLVELVGYYTLRQDGQALPEQEIRQCLRERLPGYMVPAYFERLERIPMLPSNKADRKSLPPPSGPRTTGAEEYAPPGTETEKILADALAAVLHVDKVSVTADFFADLGANSMLMAQFSGRLRKDARVSAPAMREIYLHPTVTSLAAVLRTEPVSEPADSSAERAERSARVGSLGYVLCGAFQGLFFLAAAFASSLLMVAGYIFIAADQGFLSVLWRSFVFGALSLIGLCVLPVVVKWLLVGRWTAQEFPLWGAAYLRFWVVKTLVRANPMRMFVGTPVYPLYLKALGAKIGRGVVIFSPTVPVCTDLLSIGDGALIRKDSSFACYRAHDGMIQTGAVTIGRDALVGEGSVLDIDTSLGDDAQLGHASCLYAGQSVPPGQRWHGSPAQVTGTDYRAVDPADCSSLRRLVYGIFVVFNRVFLISAVGLTAVGLLLPEYFEMDHLQPGNPRFFAYVLGISFILYFGGALVALGTIVVVPRLLNRLLVPERVYPLYGLHYVVQGMIAGMTNSRFFMQATGDSSLIVHYLRLLGYKQPGLVQTGSNFGVELKHENPYAVTIGSGTMVSDGLSIMNADFSSSSFRISPTSVGSRSFFGNNIFYPSGGRTGDNCLFGTKVMVPVDGPVREGVGLLGSPPFEIPRTVRRDVEFKEEANGPEQRARLRRKNRHNTVTLMFYLLSRWVLTFVGLLVAAYAVDLYTIHGVYAITGSLIGMLLFTVGYLILVERASFLFRTHDPMFCSIYEPSFLRHERFWKLNEPGFVDMFNGTPFKPVIWRLLGVRIGRRVFDDGCAMPEKTIVAIGDDCVLNARSTIQCHSMEDGAFKLDGISIGRNCTIGVNAFVHYGVTIGNDAVVESDSFLMKGEEVPEGATFGGNPAQELAVSSVPTVPPPARHALGGRPMLGAASECTEA